MFGLGKKKQDNPASAPASPESPAVKPAVVIPEENFTVMPSQYLARKNSGQAGDKKLFLLIGAAAVFLIILSAGLYFFFFSQRAAPGPIALTPTAPLSEVPQAAAPPSATSTAEKVVEIQAYDSANQLIGVLKMTVPTLVANKYGESLGLTALAAADVVLPADKETAGGLFAPYPIGATFEAPITLELSVSSLITPEARADFYPAYLKGINWEEIAGNQGSDKGWLFTLDKFPGGPLTAVRRSSVATSTTPIAGSAKSASTQDTDSDGLTDKEEVLLGTSISSPDTDSDTYPDKTELLNNYSPLAAGEKLETTGLFSVYTNPTYGYKVSYPAKWLSDALDQTNKQVLFISDTEEFFEILIEENPLKKPIVDWYRSQSPTLANIELDVAVIDGQGAVWSPDGLTLYLGREGLVYIITYNKGTLEAINWPSLFEYFYKSFKFGNTTSAGNPAAPAAPASEPG